jgi:hypothetical protein
MRSHLVKHLSLLIFLAALHSSAQNDNFWWAGAPKASGGGGGYTLKENIGPSPNDNNNVGDTTADTYLGQSWIPASTYSIAKVSLYIQSSGSPVGNLTCLVYVSNVAFPNLPLTVVGTSATVAASSISSSAGYVAFTFSSPAPVVSGARYYMVLTTTSISASNYIIWWGFDTTTTGYDVSTSPDGSTWTPACLACVAGTFETYTSP